MGRVPNQRLRGARRARCLTQEALAELANQRVLEITGSPGAMDADYISRLERGVHTWPAKTYRQALAAALGVQGDRELGFYSVRSVDDRFGAVGLEVIGGSADVNRLAFMQAVGGLAAGAVVAGPAWEALSRAASGGVPGRVGATEVEQVRQITEVFRGWGFHSGGGFGRPAMRGQLAWARSLLDSESSDETKSRLYQAVGALACTVGWNSFDAGYHEEARADFRTTLACAEYGLDWRLRGSVLSGMARQALYLDLADEALSLIELAQVRADRLTATARAEYAVIHAQVLARLGRTQDALRAIGIAEEQFAHRNPADDPPWVTYFDEAHLHGDAGRALLDLALRERHVPEARDRLWQAVSSYPGEHSRSRALALGELAILELRVGDPQAGVLHADQTLSAGTTVHSARSITYLCQLDDALSTHPGADALELRDRIRRMTPA